MFGSSQFKLSTFAVSGECISDDQVTGVLADQWLEDPHLCLFRIETLSSRSMGSLTRNETRLEGKANKASFEKSQGSAVKFGQQVQLRHVHSDRFLSLNLLTAASAPGAWCVSVSPPEDHLCRKISLLPFNRSHNIGDQIKCQEPTSLVFQTENLKYYLQAESVSQELLEINATHKPASWKFYRYETYNESTEAIKFGVPLLIKYSKLGVHMALKKDKPLHQKQASGGNRKPSEIVPLDMLPRELIVTKADVGDYSNYWILQEIDVLKGGCATWKSKYYIKNALTGEFVGPNLQLQKHPDPSFYFVFPKPDSFHEHSVIPFEYPLLIKSSDGRVLSLDQRKSNEEALDHLVPVKYREAQYDSGEISVVLEALGIDKRESLFSCDALPDTTIRFFRLIKALYPKVMTFKAAFEEFRTQTDLTGRRLWEAAEEIEKRLLMLLAAMQNVQLHLREAQGEEQTKKQSIITGLNFHGLLIDTAAVLHSCFGPGGEHERSFAKLSVLATKSLEVLWDLMLDSVLENDVAARLMVDHQVKLCELLKYDTRRIGALLTEVFRLVDPEIKDPKSFYREWCNRLETLTQRNLFEQVIYLKIIRNLCEIGDVGVLEYQREVTSHLFNSEIAFSILSLSFYMGETALKFGIKGQAIGSGEFKYLNPDLSSVIKVDSEGNSIVLLKDISGLPDYVEYVQAALMLYHCICNGRCLIASELVGSRLGLTLPTVFKVSQDLKIHIDIRQACLFLLEALCIAAPPFEPYTETDSSFDFAELKVEESKSKRAGSKLIQYNAEVPFISQCLRFVFDFWLRKDLPATLNLPDLSCSMNYLKAMLRITQALVEYKHCNELYSCCIFKAMLYLLAGFTDAAKKFQDSHWSAGLISKAVEQGKKDRQLELIVNDLLGCVLTTILFVKKLSRRDRLSQVVRLLISKPACFKATFLGRGFSASASLEEVTAGLKDILDPNRANRLILDFEKRAERERSKGGDPVVNDECYTPDFQFREMSANAPALKDVFIKVILEWFSFSPVLKQKMIDVMSEVFKEKKLFDKGLRSVDIFSMGPVSEMYTRLRWVKEHSEIHSLIIRARFECVMTGRSASITRITSILEYVINFIHPRTSISEFVLSKTQNIVRHLDLHKEILLLWGLINYLDKNGKGADSPTIRLKSGLSAFLYYFVRGNPLNAKEMAKLLNPQDYLLTVLQYPAFLRLINDYSHLSIRDFTRLLVLTLDEAQASDKGVGMLRLLENIMIDRYGAKKRTIQNIASTFLSERVSEAFTLYMDRPMYVAQLLKYLSLSAEDNPAVIAQCRHMLPLSRLQEIMQREENTDMLCSGLSFLHTVFLKKSAEVKVLNEVDDIREIVMRVMREAKECMSQPQELVKLALDGSYPLVFFANNPGYTEIHMNSPKDPVLLSRWSFLCFDWDGHTSGVLQVLPDILEAVQLDADMHRCLVEFCEEMRKCVVKIKMMAEKLEGLVRFTPIIAALEVAIERVKRCIPPSLIPGSLPQEEILLCEVSDDDIDQLRTTKGYSLQFPEVSQKDEDVLVDLEIGKVIKAGYLHYRKVFSSENEGDYISAIVNLIDARLASGERLSKKEVKETIPTLLRKIRRLQRLFTSSKQRTFFFRILEGIVPSEDRIQVKIQLNPLFHQAQVAEFALTAILRNEDLDASNAALSFLRKLFLLQTREFMDKFRETLDEGSYAYPLFLLIQTQLEATKSSIIEKAQIEMNKKKTNLGLLTQFAVQTKGKGPEDVTGTTKQQDLVINMLLFIQICCDNCNEPFQIFYRMQESKEGKADVDLVTALTSFIIDIRMVKDFLLSNKPVFQILDAALTAEVDLVTGPCSSNQLFLGNNVHLYLVMNTLISMCQGKEELALIDVHQKCIQFLYTLLEGHPDQSVSETMSKFLDLSMLRTGCEQVYETLVQGYETELSLESENIKPTHKGVVEAALMQAILLVKLRHIGIIHDELSKFEATLMEPTPVFEYFSRYIGYVEINRNGTQESHFFPIPWKCKYITSTTRLSIIVEVNRSSHQETIEDFLSRVPLCLREMKHQQLLYSFGWLKRLSARWQLFGKISYYIALIINIVLLASIQEPDFADLKGNLLAFMIVAILGILQILAYMACFFFNIIEYYPKTVMSGIKKPQEFEMDEFPVVDDSDSQAMHRTHCSLQGYKKKDYGEELQSKLKEVLFNFDLYYTYSYFLISMIAVYEPVFYPFLLLDMIKQTPELGNVLKSVTLNFRQLILTMWLGVILIYLFAICSFVFYKDYYEGIPNLLCDDLWNCFFSTLNVGIRSGGGIGDGLETPSSEDYWTRMLFDILFYMIIIIILLNIIFGIIIDTFAELRDKRSFVLEDIHNRCYVCGEERSVIEMRGSGWSYHFMCEHSPFAYLSFLIYLSEKKIYDCSGLEKHVKERFDKMDTSFMPTTDVEPKSDED